ncbi:MAG TPA: hypothetical protein VJ724_07225 [Tahibacter sp.]|nr:hypothetical protein [Tahibacter sp.]
MTTRAFTPSEPDLRWPGDGHYAIIAIVPLDEAAMRERLGTEPLYGDESGLGPWVAFGGYLDDGTLVEFINYAHAPEPNGFDVRVQSTANPADTLDRVLRLVRLDVSALPWIDDDVFAPYDDLYDALSSATRNVPRRRNAKRIAVKLLLTIPVAAALAYPLLVPGTNAGVFRELALVGPVGAVIIMVAFFVAVTYYCCDLQHVLERVAPESRVASPRSVWLMFLIPYNFVEDFFIVANVATSLEREAATNDALRPFASFGRRSGLGWCTAQIVSLVPHEAGSLAALAALVLWIAHWRLIRRVNAALAAR